jgi:catechol 2,3-dioxygenase-like lactoylglutathione lyase family enzyme
MTAVNVRHVGIVTTNLKESLNFYKKILGFKIVKKMKETDRSLSNIMALKNTKVTTVKMRSKDSGMIELLNWHTPKTRKKVNCKNLNEVGLTHFALTVKNLDFLYKKLKKQKIKFLYPPALSADKKVKLAFCKSPEGVFIEMVQHL